MNPEQASTHQDAAGNPGAAGISPGDAAGDSPPTDIAASCQRIARMQRLLGQDISTLRDAVTTFVEAARGDGEKLGTAIAMVARGVATGHVKVEESHRETRRAVTAQLERLEERLEREMMDRVIETRLFAPLAEAADGADEALAGVSGAQRGTPAHEALRMVRDKLLLTLRAMDVARVDVLPGRTKFDEAVHDCAGVDETADVPPGTITEMLTRGYTLRGRTLRRAKVTVKGGGSWER